MTDHNPTADQMGTNEARGPGIEVNLRSRSTWKRGIFILLSLVMVWLAAVVGFVVVVVGFFWLLFTGETNRQLTVVGQSIADYVYQVVRYLTFNTDIRPFPFGAPWPSGDQSGSPEL